MSFQSQLLHGRHRRQTFNAVIHHDLDPSPADQGTQTAKPLDVPIRITYPASATTLNSGKPLKERVKTLADQSAKRRPQRNGHVHLLPNNPTSRDNGRFGRDLGPKFLFDHDLRENNSSVGGGSSSRSITTSSYQTTSSERSISFRSPRGRGSYRNSIHEEDENDETFSPERRLACPYFKRDPAKHNKYRSCAGPGFIGIHRIKEHITRQHALPVHCRRCSEHFLVDSALNEHSREANACRIRTFQAPVGLTKEQERLLKKRKVGGSKEERWREIYKILFPDNPDDELPSPYYDDHRNSDWESRRVQEFVQLRNYLQDELPGEVMTCLKQASGDVLLPAGFPDAIHAALSEVFQKHLDRIGATREMSDAQNHGEDMDELKDLPVDQAPPSDKLQFPVDENLSTEPRVVDEDDHFMQYLEFDSYQHLSPHLEGNYFPPHGIMSSESVVPSSQPLTGLGPISSDSGYESVLVGSRFRNNDIFRERVLSPWGEAEVDEDMRMDCWFSPQR